MLFLFLVDDFRLFDVVLKEGDPSYKIVIGL